MYYPIDYPGFNLRMARWQRPTTSKLHYISPKIWAWIPQGKNHKSLCGSYVLYPSLWKGFYAQYNYEVYYFGNLLLDEIKSFVPNPIFWPNTTYISLWLHCCRVAEFRKLKNIACNGRSNPTFTGYDIVIPRSSNLEGSFNFWCHSCWSALKIKVIDNAYYDILAIAQLALVTSGTATLETALFDVPGSLLQKQETYFLAG